MILPNSASFHYVRTENDGDSVHICLLNIAIAVLAFAIFKVIA